MLERGMILSIKKTEGLDSLLGARHICQRQACCVHMIWLESYSCHGYLKGNPGSLRIKISHALQTLKGRKRTEDVLLCTFSCEKCIM